MKGMKMSNKEDPAVHTVEVNGVELIDVSNPGELVNVTTDNDDEDTE